MLLVLRVFLPFAITYLLTYASRSANAVAGEPISTELGLSPADLGFLTSVYLAGFALSQLPLGVLMDRYGPRKVEALVLLLAAVGCAAFAFASTFTELVAGRILMGVGASMSLMAPLTAFRKWFTPERLPTVIGLQMVFGAAGSAVAGRPAEAIMSMTSWRMLFAIFAVLILMAAISILFVVPAKREPSHGHTFGRMTRDLVTILKSRTMWRIAPVSAATQTGFVAIVGLWTGPWLREVAGLSPAAAASWLSVTAIGMMVGFLGMGILATRAARTGHSFHLFIGGSVVYCLVLVAIIFLPPAVATPLWIPFAMLSAGGILSFSILTTSFDEGLAGRVNTTLNCLIFIMAFLVQWLFGVVLGFYPAEAGWGASRLGYQVALGGVLAMQLLSYLPLLLPRHPSVAYRPPAEPDAMR